MRASLSSTGINSADGAITYTQVTPQFAILCRHPEPPPVLQGDKGVVRVPGPVLLQEASLEVRQHPVHVDQNPKPLTGSGRGGKHIGQNPVKRIKQSCATSQ